ncbi:MAG: 16S rRNA (adenine(1518)-N(6)/adenine(1519)-N(6))-dimethyltransferase RsmA [Pseudomonadota bacterium]
MSRPEPPQLVPVTGPDELPPLRDVIRELSLSAKKSLGQNFILDLNLTRRIARCGGDLTRYNVVEIGPGPGGLTRALLSEGAKHVVCIERDERCLPALAQISSAWPSRMTVQLGDALELDWRAVSSGLDGPCLIAANLPYGIATRLLIDWLETDPWPPWFDRMVLMFQREVADRIVAAPGSKAYGRLAVISQWRCHVNRAFNLKPEAFTPPPKVASAVVVFEPRQAPEPACSVGALGQVTAAAFGQRRKMLRTSLKQLSSMPELLIEKAGLDPQARAQDLDVAAFARLAVAWEGSAVET